MERRIRNNQKNKSARPPQTYFFGENSATELDLFGRLRTVKDELLARGVFLLLSRSHAQKLLPFVHFLSLSSLEVAGIEACAQQTWQWQHVPTPLAPRPDLILLAFGRGDKLLLHPSFMDCWELSDDTNRQNPQLWTEARSSLPCHTQSSRFVQKCESLQGKTTPT